MDRKLILIIEDDESVRGALIRAIKDDDLYDVKAVENGILAITYLENNAPPDLIITDFMMLGDGVAITTIANRVKIPIIMITAAPELAKEALDKVDILIPMYSKPFDVFEILDAVDTITKTDKRIAA
jgi:CheY-like chemotaxis protein